MQESFQFGIILNQICQTRESKLKLLNVLLCSLTSHLPKGDAEILSKFVSKCTEQRQQDQDQDHIECVRGFCSVLRFYETGVNIRLKTERECSVCAKDCYTEFINQPIVNKDGFYNNGRYMYYGEDTEFDMVDEIIDSLKKLMHVPKVCDKCVMKDESF